jgi:hypothetical protein
LVEEDGVGADSGTVPESQEGDRGRNGGSGNGVSSSSSDPVSSHS